MIVWIDTETTGLDHNKDALLEIAVVITTDDLEVVAEYTSVIKAKKKDLKRMDDFVLNLHKKSGLLRAVKVSERSISTVEAEVLDFLDRNGLTTGLVLAGNSVHFDRYFLLRLMPKLMKRFTHQNLDVTSIGHCVKRWDNASYETLKARRGEVVHRALDDIMSSIEQLRWYRKSFIDLTQPNG